MGELERIQITRGDVKTIGIITPCYNEEDNVVELFTAVA